MLKLNFFENVKYLLATSIIDVYGTHIVGVKSDNHSMKTINRRKQYTM